MYHAVITKIGGNKRDIHTGNLLALPKMGEPVRLFMEHGHFTTSRVQRVFTINNVMFIESTNSRYKINFSKFNSLEDLNLIEINLNEPTRPDVA